MTDLPVGYGYMRVPADAPEDWSRELDQALADTAEAEGLRLAGVFIDSTDGSYFALDVLIDALCDTGAHHVIVPSMGHLSTHTLMRSAIVDRLRVRAGATVVCAADPTLSVYEVEGPPASAGVPVSFPRYSTDGPG